MNQRIKPWWALVLTSAWLPLSALADTLDARAGAHDIILGQVDGVSEDPSGATVVRGWACWKGWSWTSPQVELYAGEPGQGIKIGTYWADQPSEPAVSQVCETAGIGHRFAITLTIPTRQTYPGQLIYVVALPYPGQDNRTQLNGSGSYRIPTAPAVRDTLYYVHTDRLGSNIIMTDDQAKIVYQTEYKAYGGAAEYGTKPEAPGYTGHYEDPLTGLTYMQARYYDPDLGRFMSVDPINSMPGDLFNFGRYGYANNNPMRYVDPTGMASTEPTVYVPGFFWGPGGGGGGPNNHLVFDGLTGPGEPITEPTVIATANRAPDADVSSWNVQSIHRWACSKGAASIAGATAGGFVSGALTGAANGRGHPIAIASGALFGGIGGGGAQALTNWAAPLAGESASSTLSSLLGTALQDKSPTAVATSGLVTYFGSKLGLQGGPGFQMTGRVATYVGVTTTANRGLGAGAFVAGPMFGMAGAYTDMATEAAWNNFCGN